MKRFWKIKNDKYKKESFEYLKIPENYIGRLLSEGSPFMDSLKYHINDKFFYISYDSKEQNDRNGGFCWMWYKSVDPEYKYQNGSEFFKENKYKYKGLVNSRYLKLKKIENSKKTLKDKLLEFVKWKI